MIIRLSAVALLAAVLAGCSMGSSQSSEPNQSGGGLSSPAASDYHQTRPDAVPFDQANAACWKQGEGEPAAGQSSRRMAYEKCMNGKGWDNPAFQR